MMINYSGDFHADVQKVVELEKAGLELEPHRIANYLQELAAEFHNYYTQCPVLGDDERLTRARLRLVSAVRVVLGNALHLMGVHIPEVM